MLLEDMYLRKQQENMRFKEGDILKFKMPKEQLSLGDSMMSEEEFVFMRYESNERFDAVARLFTQDEERSFWIQTSGFCLSRGRRYVLTEVLNV